jgi:ribosomal protein S18 acetylase RimI-like enzyme
MKTLNTQNILERIEADTARMLRAEREAVQAGPLMAAFHPTSDMVWVNYAVPIAPTDEAEAVRAALPRLRAEFERRGRVLRFEYLAARHPKLAAFLEEFGLGRQLEAPLMTCSPADVRLIEPRGFELQRLEADAAESILADFRRVGKAGFGMPDATAEPHEVEELREALRLGRWQCVMARSEGTAIAVGTFCTGNCELAGVATLPEFRRRGVAAAVSSRLLADHFASGGEWAWLSAGDEIARALYLKVGFQDAGVQLNYIAAAEVLKTPTPPDR